MKCDEDGIPLKEEEEDISEPWDIDWDKGEVICHEELEELEVIQLDTKPQTTPSYISSTPPQHQTPSYISSLPNQSNYDLPSVPSRPPPTPSDYSNSPMPSYLSNLPAVPSRQPPTPTSYSNSTQNQFNSSFPTREPPKPSDFTSSNTQMEPSPYGAPPPINRSTKPPINRDTKPPLSTSSSKTDITKRGRRRTSNTNVQQQEDGDQSPLTKRASLMLKKTQSTLKSSSGTIKSSISNFELLDYKPKEDHSHIGMRVCICVNGWVWNKQEFTTNWVHVREMDPSMECYGLRWESDKLQDLGRGLVKVLTKSLALQILKLWIISASAVAAGLLAAFAWPAAGKFFSFLKVFFVFLLIFLYLKLLLLLVLLIILGLLFLLKLRKQVFY